MKITAISIVACVIAFMLSGLAFAQADNAPVSGVSATAFAPFPFDEVLEVRTGRDLPLERDLVDEVLKLLRARGFQVAEKGQIVVTVDSTTPLPGIAARNAFTNDDRLRSMDAQRNDRGVTMRFDYSNAEPGAAVFTMRMSAYRPGQSNLWVGEASTPDNGSGRRSTTLQLADALVDVLGRSEPVNTGN